MRTPAISLHPIGIVRCTRAEAVDDRWLRSRYDRSHEIHQRFLTLGRIKLAHQRLEGLC